MIDRNDIPRSIPFGVRVRLQASNDVRKESWGLLGTTVDPVATGDEILIANLEANPQYNVVRLDERPAHLIFMMDDTLDLVEGAINCDFCAKGLYLVLLASGVTVCDVCLTQSDGGDKIEGPADEDDGIPEENMDGEDHRYMPAPGTWADVARIMAEGDDSGFDWDAWKDEMKEGGL